MGNVDSSIEAAKNAWNATDISEVRDVAWLSIGYFSAKVAEQFLGGKSAVEYIKESLAQAGATENLRGAAIICGDMQGEKVFFDESFARVDGYDLSEVSLQRYGNEDARFKQNVVDCNDLVLDHEVYDLCVGLHGLHHVYNLGGLFYQIRKSLKARGLLYVYEWIGPEYLQIPKANRVIATVILWCLFGKRERTNHMGRVKGVWLQDPPHAFDPSEACNASELLPQMKKYFDIQHKVEFGGLCYPVFEGIAPNFSQEKIFDMMRIKSVYLIERILTSMGIVKPLFMIALARKRDALWKNGMLNDKGLGTGR